MRKQRLRHVILLILFVAHPSWLAARPIEAQSDVPSASSPEEVPASRPQPISDVEISERAASARELAREAMSKIAPDERLHQIEREFPVEKRLVAELHQETDELLRSSGSTLFLLEGDKATLRARDRLARWMRDLSTRAEDLQSILQELRDKRSLWELTRDVEREEALPEVLRQEISEALEALGEGAIAARAARDSVLALQASVSQQHGVLVEILARQRNEVARRAAAILAVDSPPVWKTLRLNEEERGRVAQQSGALAKRLWQDLRSYVSEEATPLLTWLLIWAGLAGLLILLRRRARAWARQDPSLGPTVEALGRPMAAAAVLMLVVGYLFETRAPAAWLDVLNLLLLLTMLFLLHGTLPKTLRPQLYLLVPLYLFFELVVFAPVGSLVQRLAMLALSLVGVAFCVGLLWVLRGDIAGLSRTWRRALAHGLRLAIALFAVGLAANLLGRASFGALLAAGTTEAILAGIIFWVASVLSRSMVRLALLTKTAHRLGIAPDHSEAVRERTFGVIGILAVVFWAGFTVRGFGLWDPLVIRVQNAVGAELSIGEFSLSLGAILTFVVILWLSVKLAALVAFLLGEIILPRLGLPQGAPHAISRVSRYVTLFLGLLLAIKALGFDISQATIVAGGLGVGVGFGLQSVVHNFVSGLILLFERPIRVGDLVEVSGTDGKVEKIGTRATLVRTWKGSEVVVPNAKLISSDVVNWTLKNDRRRLEIPVGVAYGTDPEVVAKLLVEIAQLHPRIDAFPEPQCLFLGFGDSSLDFQLRAWAAAGEYFGIESDLRFAITRALDEAGITIPFPQRDLHLHPAGGQLPAETPTGTDPSDS